MNIFEPLYILSAHYGLISDADNKLRADGLRAYLNLKGYGVKQVLGCYKGEREISFLILGIDESEALALARAYGQESVLHVDANRAASLVYSHADRARLPLGRFQAVPADQVADLDAYTIDPQTGLVWCAK